MATILTSAINENANSSVDTYISTAQSLYEELSGLINGMIGNDFVGDAADGYKAFFDEKVTPALTENLTDQGTSLTASIKSILTSIKEQLLDSVDPQLGEVNRDPSSAK